MNAWISIRDKTPKDTGYEKAIEQTVEKRVNEMNAEQVLEWIVKLVGSFEKEKEEASRKCEELRKQAENAQNKKNDKQIVRQNFLGEKQGMHA